MRTESKISKFHNSPLDVTAVSPALSSSRLGWVVLLLQLRSLMERDKASFLLKGREKQGGCTHTELLSGGSSNSHPAIVLWSEDSQWVLLRSQRGKITITAVKLQWTDTEIAFGPYYYNSLTVHRAAHVKVESKSVLMGPNKRLHVMYVLWLGLTLFLCQMKIGILRTLSNSQNSLSWLKLW